MHEDDVLEVDLPPVFQLGDKVRAKTLIRNDGSLLGKHVGDVLIQPGDTGYVRGIAPFLQRHVIYDVDFLDRRLVIGMRAKELDLIEAAPQ